MKYAVVKDGTIIEYRTYDYTPTGLKLVGGLPMLRPVVFVPAVGYDARKHNKQIVTTIENTQVVETETLVLIPLAQVKTNELARIRSEAMGVAYGKYPLFRQINAVLGAYPAAYLTQLRADIASVVTASNTAEASITAATTADDAIAVTATWPAI